MRLDFQVSERAGKQKDHVGCVDNYNFNKTAFLEHLKNTPTGSEVNWTLLATKMFPVSSKKTGLPVKNGNKVLIKVAEKTA